MMFLRPPTVVDVVVVVARRRHRHSEEIGIHEHRCRGHEAAAGMAVDADSINVDEYVAGGELLDRGLLVGKTVITQVAVPIVMVPFRTCRMPTAIPDRNHNEAKLRQGRLVAIGGERLRDGFGLRSGINVGDDRVGLRGIEVKRLVDHAVKISDVIIGLHRVWFRKPIAGLQEFREIGFLEIEDSPTCNVIESRCRSRVDPRVVVHEEAVRLAHTHTVIEIAGIEQRQAAAIEVYSIQVLVVRVLAGFPGVCDEVNRTTLFIDAHDLPNRPRALRQPVSQRAVGAEPVEMRPTIALRPPQQVT